MVFCDITGVGIIEEENKAGDRECTQLNSTQLTRVFVSVFPSTFFGDDIPPLSVLQYIRAVRTYLAIVCCLALWRIFFAAVGLCLV